MCVNLEKVYYNQSLYCDPSTPSTPHHPHLQWINVCVAAPAGEQTPITGNHTGAIRVPFADPSLDVHAAPDPSAHSAAGLASVAGRVEEGGLFMRTPAVVSPY
jgi:hypothetical protein